MLRSKLAKRSCLLLLLAIIAFYFYGLGHLPFVGPDEPRYAQVAREMFLRRDLITPTLAGHNWFEKPVLLYWMMQLSFGLFGISEWSARLVPAACGVLTVISVYWIGKRLENLSGDSELRHLRCWSALILASTPGIIVFSRGASFDIVVTMTLTWALGSFLLAEIEGDRKRRQKLMLGFYVFMGLSLLAKGLVGLVIPLGVVSLYYIMRRSLPKRWFLTSLLWGLPLTMIVAAIWYAPAIARHGWPFIDQFLIQHHFARYVSNKYSHPQPFFFYLLILFPIALPWLVLTIEAFSKVRNWDWAGKTPLDKFRVFCLAWILMPLIFFSFSGSKLPGYILPILPAVALLAGERLTRFLLGRSSFLSMRLMASTLLLFGTGVIVYAAISGTPSIACAVLIVMPLMLAGVASLVFLPFRVFPALVIALAIPFTIVLALNCDVARIASTYSVRHLIEKADARGYGFAQVYSLHEVDRGIEFYAAGRVVYDATGQPRKFEGAEELLRVANKTGSTVLVIVPLKWTNQLTDLESAEAEVIADNGVLAIVAVRRRN